MILASILYTGEAHAINTNNEWYRLVSWAWYITIAAHGICKQVRNASGPDIFVPTKSASEWSFFLAIHPAWEKMDCTHSWQTSWFGSCDATCGPGNRHQIVSCKRHNGDIVSDSWCSLSGPKPATTQSCNLWACIPLINGSCGPSGWASFPSAPTAGLCATGNPTSVSGFGPWWWSCLGTGGGMDMGCGASISATTPWLCGTSHASYFVSAPTGGLCSSGIPTIVIGSGPWNWNCNSIDGGSNMSCSANYSLVPADCIAGTYYWYHVWIGSMNLDPLPHWSNQSVTKSVYGTPSNGKTDYTATANCNNGSVTITGETPAVSCDSGYSWDGSSCIATPVKCYSVSMASAKTFAYIGPSWTYAWSKRCKSNIKSDMEAWTDCSTGAPKIPYLNGTFSNGTSWDNQCVYTMWWYEYWWELSCWEIACK